MLVDIYFTAIHERNKRNQVCKVHAWKDYHRVLKWLQLLEMIEVIIIMIIIIE